MAAVDSDAETVLDDGGVDDTLDLEFELMSLHVDRGAYDPPLPSYYLDANAGMYDHLPVKEERSGMGTMWKMADGRPHRGGDLPAKKWTNGRVEYWYMGERHRFFDRPAVKKVGVAEYWIGGRRWRHGDMPAVIHRRASGLIEKQVWFVNNVISRADDKPAVVTAHDTRIWYIDGRRGRHFKRPAMIDYRQGIYQWYINGRRGRDDDLPAFEDRLSGVHVWYVDGVVGRAGDKPAHVDYKKGIQKWMVNGVMGRAGDKPAYVSMEQQVWYHHGKIGRSGDRPAIVCADGALEWRILGEMRREGDKPQSILSDGTRMWGSFFTPHRDSDLPAVITADGCHKYYRRGALHRDGDRPAVIMLNGDVEYYRDGMLWRANDMPSQVYADGTQKWYVGGKLGRRGNQPAVSYPDGRVEYWEHGTRMAVPVASTWTRNEHVRWAGHPGHAGVNGLLGTFLMGCRQVLDNGAGTSDPVASHVYESMFDADTTTLVWSDLIATRSG